MPENVVETRNLSKVYRDFWGRRKKVALNALDLKITKGEIFGLLGPNGSGKTTTIKLLLGLLFPTSGDAFVFGEPAAKVEKNERIGYLPEESYLYRFLNAEETLDFYGRLFKLDPEVRKQRAAELIDRVGLSADKKRIVKESPELRADLEAVFRKHGGTLETVGHPSSTLEELFLRVIEESKARPGRRYLPPEAGAAPAAAAPGPAAPAPMPAGSPALPPV